MKRLARLSRIGRRLRRPSYAELVSTLALVVALGTGGAYAVDQIGSKGIKDNSIRSRDLRNGSAVRGVDVVKDSLGQRQIDESTLVATEIIPVGTSEGPNCVLASTDEVSCGRVVVRLRRKGRVMAIVSGSIVTAEDSPAGVTAQCAVHENGQDFSLNRGIGDAAVVTSPGSGNGFAHTYLSPNLRPPGRYVVELVCSRFGSGTGMVESPTLLAFALTSR